MKYSDGCPFLKVSRWHNLWRSNIPNLCSLKQQAGVSGFVAIDAEPWGDSLTDVVEIGIAFIPPVDIEALQGPPRSLYSLQTRYPIQVSKIRVAGREQGRGRKRESFIFGPTHIVEPDAVHETLQRLFQSFRDALGPQASLTLIGFDLAFEFRVMSSTYLGITEHISSWVDLQEIIKDVSTRTNCSPSMRESLIAFGFEGDNRAILPKHMAHSAGTDALRIIALLVNLLALSPDVTLEIDRRPVRKWGGTGRVARRHQKAQNQFSGRPTPKESYPFRARIRLNGGSAFNMRKIADSFSRYGPSASGIHRAKHEGYVCLPSLDELDQFIEQTNGSSAGNGQFWIAISEFDPQVTASRTAPELLESLKATSAATIEQKRVLRKQKKEKEKLDSEQTCSEFF
ncbi:hypothetical protein KVR01_004952 [Diaporthe batatas]|uniref:uncharacterized protein n=1 Tax=Diaporthe batatas TaxID=748121 RepID=UPI001D0507A9|nr:uncharacterized protein KVR01_004952 [Diaporthe batatas]KAG8164677.1 hypothetical protein KVR01_004952 [Diaporthe batatas]